jgi:hypothetical protein
MPINLMTWMLAQAITRRRPSIRPPVHLNGMIYRFYVKPNREVVLKINLLNGHGSPLRY